MLCCMFSEPPDTIPNKQQKKIYIKLLCVFFYSIHRDWINACRTNNNNIENLRPNIMDLQIGRENNNKKYACQFAPST